MNESIFHKELIKVSISIPFNIMGKNLTGPELARSKAVEHHWRGWRVKGKDHSDWDGTGLDNRL